MITSPKIPTDLLWGLSAFFVGLALVYLVSVFYFRNKITREAQKIRDKKKELSPIVSEFLFYDENGDKIEKINYIGLKIEVRELIKSTFDRKVLTEILMDLRKDVSGSTRMELFHIYQDLGLHEDAYKKLKSWRWEIIAKGIFELTQMHVEEAYKPITRFINDRRPTVRKQAELAVVTLKREGITFFLDHTKYKISEWQQLKLLDVVRNREDYIAPPFRLWLTSKNNYVVLFALRLIKHYNQNDASSSLITLVHHKSNHIKREAIHCIMEFNITEALPVLKSVFEKNNTDIRMHILDTIAEIGNEADIPFLENIDGGNYAFMVKNKAVRAINTIKPEAILPTKDIDKEPLSYGSEKEVSIKFIEEEREANLQHESLGATSSLESHKETHQGSQDIMEDPSLKIENVSLKTESPECSSARTELNEFQMQDEHSVTLSASEIAFLPVVIESDTVKSDKDIKSFETCVEDLEVEFEELKIERTPLEFDVSFLPLVTDEQQNLPTNPLELFVVFDEVIVLPKERPVDIRLFNVDYEVVLPFEETPVTDLSPMDLLDFSGLNQSAVDCIEDLLEQEDQEGNYMEWPLDIDIPIHEEAPQEIELFEPKEDNEQVFPLNPIIPKPKFHEELETMALLENIEELGDEREIPLLKSMLETETSSIVLQKIGDILDFFISNDINQEATENDETIKEYSVFEELIYKGDLESKLFLLNEIGVLGDAKELPLLNKLVMDENKQVREMAIKTLEKLINRLEGADLLGKGPSDDSSMESIEELIKKDDPDFFKLNFELNGFTESEDITEVSSNSNSTERVTLFDHLCNISTKFYNKNNG